ncbi:hypothetical protein FOMA001_g17363 [Fusarium oxysporum f. sp. matthiolae]|nr:hypothetical protein FOMA001_g17363 [Fusarium oxysporum f. sp. matthiolae]
MESGLVNADKLGRALTNSLCFVIRKWKMIMLSYVFIAAIGSTLLFMRNGPSPLPSLNLPPTNTVRTRSILPRSAKLGRF